jgi:hypothetical protein
MAEQQSPPNATVRRIFWNGTEWECEPFNLRVVKRLSGGTSPVDIDPKGIHLKSDPDWIELAEPEKQLDSWLIPVRLKPGVVIAPARQAAFTDVGGSLHTATFRVGKEVPPKPPVQNQLMAVNVTVSVQVLADTLMAGVLAAAGGVAPGVGGAIAAGMGLTGSLRYVVQPPVVKWTVTQKRPFRLAGLAGQTLTTEIGEDVDDSDPDAIVLRAEPLPPGGWDDLATVDVGLTDKSEKLDVVIAAIEADAEDKEHLAGRLTLQSRKLVVHPTGAVDAGNKDIVGLELTAVTRSRNLGTQVQKGLFVDAEPLDCAVYLRNEPPKSHEWKPADDFFLSDLNKIAPVPDDAVNSPPAISTLGIRLTSPPQWGSPDVHWYTEDQFRTLENTTWRETPLDDRVQEPTALETIYQAPSKKSWEAAFKPNFVKVVCLVGEPGDNPSAAPVPDWPDLYFRVPIESDVQLAERLRKVRVKVRIGPKDMMQSTTGPLVDVPVETRDGLVRTFTVDLRFV